MDIRRPQNCKWAEPTLHQPWPFWLDAWSWPWSCCRGDVPRPLGTTDECRECVMWEERGGGAPVQAGALVGRRCGSV